MPGRCAERLLVVLTALALVGCGSAAEPSRPPVAATATATATADPAIDDRIRDAEVVRGAFAGDAVERFGQDEVDAGYAEMAEFMSEQTFNEDLIGARVDSLSAEDFEGLTDRMTPTMTEGYRQAVTRALDGDEETAGTVQAITYYGFTSDTVEFASDGPLVVNHRITNPKVGVDTSTGPTRLAVSFQHSGDIRVTSEGAAQVVPVEKSVTFWLVPTPDGSDHRWQIDGFSGNWEMGDLKPDTGQY